MAWTGQADPTLNSNFPFSFSGHETCTKRRISVVFSGQFLSRGGLMPRQSALRIWVGTRKGAFAFSSKDRKKWTAEGPFLAGEEVHHVAQDPRDPNHLYATGGNAWIGPHLYASRDAGKTWKLSEN